MASTDTRYVQLRGGLVLPVDPVLLALELEERGIRMTREDGDVLNVQPYQQLTPDDRQRIKRWKSHLLSIVDYTEPVEVIQ